MWGEVEQTHPFCSFFEEMPKCTWADQVYRLYTLPLLFLDDGPQVSHQITIGGKKTQCAIVHLHLQIHSGDWITCLGFIFLVYDEFYVKYHVH